MAQSSTTCTPSSPTPPTNFGSTGVSGPNPPNFQRQNYANPFNLNASGQPQAPYGVNPNPPPYYDDGVGGSGLVFAANVAALTAGTSANDTGTGTTISTAATGAGGSGVNSVAGTYAGAGTPATSLPYNVGPVPASTSVAAEGAGTEVAVTQTYSASIYNPAGPLVTTSTLGNYTQNPNRDHASSLSPTTNPALTTISPTTSVHGTAAITMTATGTNFTRQSKITIAGVPQTTTYVSATSLTCLATPPAAAGTPAVTVVTGGVVTTAPQTWTIT